MVRSRTLAQPSVAIETVDLHRHTARRSLAGDSRAEPQKGFRSWAASPRVQDDGAIPSRSPRALSQFFRNALDEPVRIDGLGQQRDTGKLRGYARPVVSADHHQGYAPRRKFLIECKG